WPLGRHVRMKAAASTFWVTTCVRPQPAGPNGSVGDVPAAVRAAAHAVRCAPLNPDAWLTLAGTFGYFADVVRRGRTIGEMQPGGRLSRDGRSHQAFPEQQASAGLSRARTGQAAVTGESQPLGDRETKVE